MATKGEKKRCDPVGDKPAQAVILTGGTGSPLLLKAICGGRKVKGKLDRPKRGGSQRQKVHGLRL